MAVKPSAPEQVATEEASATSWVPKGRTSSSRDLPATQSAQHIAESEAEVSTRRPLCVRFWERWFPGRNYGHLVLAASLPIILGGTPGQSFFLGLYTDSLIQEFGISVQFVSALFFITFFAAMFWLQGIGRLVDRIGARRTISLALLPYIASIICLSLAPTATFIAPFYVLMRVLGVETIDFAAKVTINRWFRRNRGRAMAVATIALGMELHMASANNLMMQTLGWRAATQVSAGVVLCLVLLGLAPFEDSPEALGMRPDAGVAGQESSLKPGESRRQLVGTEEEEEVNFTFKEAASTFQCWGICWLSFVCSCSWGGMNVHMGVLFARRGLPGSTLSGVYTLIGAVCPVTAFLLGSLLDRIPLTAHKLALFVIAPLANMCALLTAAWSTSVGGALLFGTFTGVFLGAFYLFVYTCSAMLFGRQHLGAIQALSTGAGVLGVALGPLLFSAVLAASHSYTPVLVAMAGASFLGAGIPVWAGKPPRPQRLRGSLGPEGAAAGLALQDALGTSAEAAEHDDEEGNGAQQRAGAEGEVV